MLLAKLYWATVLQWQLKGTGHLTQDRGGSILQQMFGCCLMLTLQMSVAIWFYSVPVCSWNTNIFKTKSNLKFPAGKCPLTAMPIAQSRSPVFSCVAVGAPFALSAQGFHNKKSF